MRKSVIVLSLIIASLFLLNVHNVSAVANPKHVDQEYYGVIVKPAGNHEAEYLFKVIKEGDLIKSVGAFVKLDNKVEFKKVFIVNSESVKLLINPFSNHITMIKDDAVTIPESFTVSISVSGNNISVKTRGMGEVVKVMKVNNKWPFGNEEKPPITPKPPVPPVKPPVNEIQKMYPAKSVFDYAYIVYLPITGYSSDELKSELPDSNIPVSTVILKVKKNMSITVNNITIVSKNGAVSMSVDKKLPVTLKYEDELKVSFTVNPKVNNFPLIYGMMPIMKDKHVEGHPSFGSDVYTNPVYRQVIVKYLFLGNGCVMFIDASVDGNNIKYFLPMGVRTVPLIPLYRFLTILR